MKKIIALLIVGLLLATAFSVGSFAEFTGTNWGDAKRATPRIDGKKDDVYDKGVEVVIGKYNAEQYAPMVNDENYDRNYRGPYTLKEGDVKCRILWDDSYMYIFATAHDETPMVNDQIGFFFYYEDFVYAITCYYDGEAELSDEHDYDMYSTQAIVNTRPEDNEWDVEIAIANYSLEDGFQFGFHLFYGNRDDVQGAAGDWEKYTSGIFWSDYFTTVMEDAEERQADITTEPKTDDSDAPGGDDTTAPNGDVTTAPQSDVTTAPQGDVTTAPAQEKSGCGSVVGTAVVSLVILTTIPVFTFRKKEN